MALQSWSSSCGTRTVNQQVARGWVHRCAFIHYSGAVAGKNNASSGRHGAALNMVQVIRVQ